MINKIIILVFILVFSYGCKDNVTKDGNTQTIVNTPPVTPEPNDNISPYTFLGIQSIDEVEQTQLKVHWTAIPEAGSYQVFFITSSGLELQKTFNHPKDNAVLTNLTPGAEYKILVRMMDKQGRIDINEKYLRAQTLLWPIYKNQKSLELNGSQSVQLKSSQDLMNTGNFTVSLWFKTNFKQTFYDSRLFTAHSSVQASTALSLGVEGDNIILIYKNSNDEIKKIETQFDYSNNQWHHLALTYNQRWYTLYIDGVRVKSHEDSIGKFGSQPVSIASYVGIQKGFMGLIDEVSLWTSALGKVDIQNIYDAGKSNDLKQHQRSNVIKAWYRLGDDSADNSTHIQDQIGTFHGAPIGVDNSDFVTDAP